AQALLDDPGFSLVALNEVDPAKLAKTCGELAGGKRAGGPRVSATLPNDSIDVAIVTTASHFDRVCPTLRELIARKTHVVSSCEEMAFPRYRHANLTDEIDAQAKAAGVALVGTGVNPGFVMDLLPLVLSSMVLEVRGLRCVRRVNASMRRKPLQAKIGSTMTADHFRALARDGKIGHMGLPESIAMIAAGLGRHAALGSIQISLEPVVAERETQSLLGPIRAGQVCGMRNRGCFRGMGLDIELDLTMALDLPDPHDAVELSGPVPLKLRIENSTPGDSATVAALVNYSRIVPTAAPGLHTVLTLPPASCRRPAGA
ncbi:MAG: dihydrodipicolinate reductase, partial [Tepidisphaeraceae bacterium]